MCFAGLCCVVSVEFCVRFEGGGLRPSFAEMGFELRRSVENGSGMGIDNEYDSGLYSLFCVLHSPSIYIK